MKTNQLFVAGIRFLATYFIASLLGFFTGSVYLSEKNEIVSESTEISPSKANIFEVGEEFMQLRIADFTTNLIAIKSRSYTYEPPMESGMNNLLLKAKQFEFLAECMETQEVENRPLVPPPRQSLARSDLIDLVDTG